MTATAGAAAETGKGRAGHGDGLPSVDDLRAASNYLRTLVPAGRRTADYARLDHIAGLFDRLSVSPDILDALIKLSNEVIGTLPLFSELARQEFGNTNYACLIRRAEEARAVISKAEGRP